MRFLRAFFILAALLSGTVAHGEFLTPLASRDLDPAFFAQWVEGAESAVPETKRGPAAVLWTRDSTPEWNGATFGKSTAPGDRHLRVGFRAPVPIGSVLVRAGGKLSVLKPGAAYPGRLDKEEDWLPAQRTTAAEVTDRSVGREEYAVWVLPPDTKTRALRFTHVPQPTDKEYAGWVGGAFVLTQRVANVAPAAVAITDANSGKALRINNGSNDGTWEAWDNAPDANAAPVTNQRPVLVTLAWRQNVAIRGVNAIWAGFARVEVQSFTGSPDKHPRDASESEWRTIRDFPGIQHRYPLSLGVNWLDFGSEVTTRALRLRITQPISEVGIHEHVRGNSRAGRRVWLGELMALRDLASNDLNAAVIKTESVAQVQPPIPIRFSLPEPGFVSLIIDDPAGRRVRNLVSETPFPAGTNTAWWDGTDDLLRDADAAHHGVYRIPPQFVKPGSYRIRGLWRKQIDLRYEFSIYNAGSPAWETASGTGGWLANHTPPSAALFVPARRGAHGSNDMVYLGSFVSEGGHGLAWVNLDGRKQGGVGWVGGTWTGAAYLARDDGPDALTNVAAYAAAPWSVETYADRAKDKRGEVRITAITRAGMKPAAKYIFTPQFEVNPDKPKDNDWFSQLGGFAVRDGILAFSLTTKNEIVLIDTRRTNEIVTLPVRSPRGLAFDGEGRLLAVSGTQVLRFHSSPSSLLGNRQTATPRALIAKGLEEPRQVLVHSDGNILVSDHGNSHQVKLFSPDGALTRAIGNPGAPKAGAYEPLHMNQPFGMTIDSQQRLWVAENDYQPKRVSVWTLEGRLLRAFYGPSEYGGGGRLDPEDKTKFYYHGMEFRLDWDKGTDQLVNVFHRPSKTSTPLPGGYFGPPENPFSFRGRRYWANDHNSNPTGGAAAGMIWADVGGVAKPVAALGRANDWRLLRRDEFRKLWPRGVDLDGDYWKNIAWFTWSDRNDDGDVQPAEITLRREMFGSVTVAPDLSFIASRVGEKALRFKPTRFTGSGVPIYDGDAAEVLVRDAQSPTSSGGDQALWHESGWTVLTTPPKPFSPLSLGGALDGEPRWSYPNPWPGLHASHESPPPEFPGQVIGATRLIGPFVVPLMSDAGPLWAINANQGNIYVFTVDGLFVAELFKDVRRGPTWSMPRAERGMLLNGLTLKDENFWPSMTQTKDGNVYVCDGARTSLVRVDGLETIRRLPESTIEIRREDLARAREYFVAAEAKRQAMQGGGAARVPMLRTAPAVDGNLDDWSGVEWIEVDKRGVTAYFDSKSKPYDVRGALAVSGDRLYAAFRTGDAELLRNTGENPQALFKTGGALDLMLGTNPSADEKRNKPVDGDIRLLATMTRRGPIAMLYRAVVPGTREPVPFSSPWRTITLDRVEDVSSDVRIAGKEGNYELSIPLKVLGVSPKAGLRLKGDLGILRGNGFQTIQRVYWSNKASAITADVPSEAELTPGLWGRLEFVESLNR